MPTLERIRFAWDSLIARLRPLWYHSHTVILNIEATYDSNDTPVPADAESKSEARSDEAVHVPARQATDNKTTNQTLYVKFSDRSIEVDGQKTQPSKSVMTEECLVMVLQKHPKLEDVTHMVITHHLNLYRIPLFIGKLINLTILDLSANNLQDLPWSIVYLKKLKILNLSGNKFYTIPPLIGRLTRLEQLLLNDNCLEYLPTSFLQLEKLRVLQVSGNPRLVAPPLAVCEQGLDAIFSHLKKRNCGRRNLWNNNPRFYSLESSDSNANQKKVKSLLEQCVSTVLQFNIDFFSQSFFPPPLKRHLYDKSKVKMAAVCVAKCSQCRAYFSSEAYFEGHDCRR